MMRRWSLVLTACAVLAGALTLSPPVHAEGEQMGVDGAVSLFEDGAVPEGAELEAAYVVLVDAAAASGASEAVLIAASKACVAKEEYKLARTHGETATKRAGASADAFAQYGMACFMSARTAGLLSAGGLAKKGRKALERAVELDPQHTEALEGLAGFYLFAPGIAGGDKKKGEKYARQLAAIEGEEIGGHVLLATRFIMSKDWDKADAELDKAEGYASTPEDYDTVDRARLQMLWERKEYSAVVSFVQAIENGRGADNYVLFYYLGMAQQELDRHEDAVEAFRTVIELRDSVQNTRFKLAESLEELDRFAESLEMYESYLEVAPKGEYAKKAKKGAKRMRKKTRS